MVPNSHLANDGAYFIVDLLDAVIMYLDPAEVYNSSNWHLHRFAKRPMRQNDKAFEESRLEVHKCIKRQKKVLR